MVSKIVFPSCPHCQGICDHGARELQLLAINRMDLGVPPPFFPGIRIFLEHLRKPRKNGLLFNDGFQGSESF